MCLRLFLDPTSQWVGLYHAVANAWLILKTLTIPSLIRMFSNQNTCTLLVGIENGVTTSENSMTASQKVKHQHVSPNTSTPQALPKRNKNLYPHEDLIDECSKLETNQILSNRWTDKRSVMLLEWDVTHP